MAAPAFAHRLDEYLQATTIDVARTDSTIATISKGSKSSDIGRPMAYE